MEKSLGNTDANGTKKNVKDVVFFGNGDTFKLLCKASSQDEGWMKSSKAMEIPGVGCVVQVTTQQKNLDGSYAVAEAVCFVPNVKIEELTSDGGGVTERRLVADYSMMAYATAEFSSRSCCCGDQEETGVQKAPIEEVKTA